MDIFIFSGMQPGATGVGRLVSELTKQSRHLSGEIVRFAFGPSGGLTLISAIRRMRFRQIPSIIRNQTQIRMHFNQMMRAVTENPIPLILIHPQTIGLKNSLYIIQKRQEPTWLYSMDSSFFCVRSYNHIPGENGACLRCLKGKWDNIDSHRCRPFPRQSLHENLAFLKGLLKMVRIGKVKILAQSESQADLARAHFGREVDIRIVGMWADFGDLQNHPSISRVPRPSKAPFDIVFHGMNIPAKGSTWSVELARTCKEWTFLFPFNRPFRHLDSRQLSNCLFSPMSWETGLREAVYQAAIVLVPSLWSAPIEGALIKSIVHSRRTAVVREPSAFSSEVPDEIVLKLSPDIEEAAGDIRMIQKEPPPPYSHVKKQWIAQFSQSNADLLKRVVENVHQGMKTGTRAH